MILLCRARLAAPVLAAALAGCDLSTSPRQNLTEIPIELDFCAGDVPVWFAYQNQSRPWEVVTPDASGTVRFTATDRVGVAFVFQEGADARTEMVFTSNQDLEKISGASCLEETGVKTASGSVTGLTGTQVALVGMSFASAYLDTDGTFTLTQLADRPLDLIASRQTLNGATQHANRLVLRRSQNFVSGATMPAIDLAAGTAPVVQTATVTGILASDDEALLLNNFFSQLETTHVLSVVQPLTNGTVPFMEVPASLLAAGDYHDLFAMTFSGATSRGVERFHTTPGDQTLAIGPPLATPVVTTASTQPYVRFRTQLAAQTDYSSVVSLEFFQEQQFSTTEVVITVTASHFGGTPVVWDLTIPDLSAVPGFQTTWGLRGGSVAWSVIAFLGRPELVFGGRPAQNETVKFATSASSTSAIQAHRAGAPRPPRVRPFTRAR